MNRCPFSPAQNEGKRVMRLSPPTLLLFLISLVFALLAMVTKLGYLPVPRYLPHQEYWLAITAYMVLTVGVLFRGL
jgi:hypothetical protein